MVRPESFLTASSILGTLGLALILLALGTPAWRTYTVQRTTSIIAEENGTEDTLKKLVYYSRDEGLVTLCFHGAISLMTKLEKNLKTDSSCILQDWEFPKSKTKTDMSKAYWTRIHISRACILTIIVGALLALVAILLGLAGCWKCNLRQVTNAGIILLTSGILFLVAIALYHVSLYVYDNRLEEECPPGQLPFIRTWSDGLKKNTSTRLSWSYFTACGGTFLTLVASILYLIVGCCLTSGTGDENEDFECKENSENSYRRTADSEKWSSPGGKEVQDYIDLSKEPFFCKETPTVFAYDASYIAHDMSPQVEAVCKNPSIVWSQSKKINNSWNWK